MFDGTGSDVVASIGCAAPLKSKQLPRYLLETKEEATKTRTFGRIDPLYEAARLPLA